ncbi:MAG: serine protease [Acetobacteraceae bacterium]|nr:serine protease [Acetobacteraceae bacterium]
MTQDDDPPQVPDWEIPTNLQPDPEDYGFDLERTLKSVVGLRANVPSDAYTAGTLGTDRVGNGVVIREDGLVLTIGYLITEAETVWLITNDGRAVPGHALAFDQISGFGLVQALGRLGLPAIELGDSDALAVGAEAVMAAGGGRAHAIEAKVVGRQEFAGYWEYLLDNAIFTAPAHPFWSGSALIGRDGKLLGTGSLILQQGDGKRRMDMNMIVPVADLRPVLDDLLNYGRVRKPPRPWLGLYAMEGDGGLVVGGVSDRGPAAKAGVQQGDRILGLGDDEVSDLGSLWRKLWAAGPAGTPVTLKINRDGTRMTVRVMSADRTSFLRAPRLH